MQDDLNKKRPTPARPTTGTVTGSEEASETMRLVDTIDSEDEDEDTVIDVDVENTPDTLELDPDINLDSLP